MSVVAAIGREGAAVRGAEIRRMAERMPPRGAAPSAWTAGSAGLAAAATAGRWAIAADARLDNAAELAARLGLPGGTGDAGVILAAYRRWGTDAPARLLGDFAFVLWDAERREFFGARDLFGVRPFFYHAGARLFACASEIKALLRLAELPRRLDEVRVADYLAGQLDDAEITFYRDIRRLPPACWIRVRDGAARVQRYWTLDAARVEPPASDDAFAEEFRALFRRAVERRTVGGGRVGSLLSGGLDSSAVVCAARELRPIDTFSATFATLPRCDERLYQRAVVAGGNVTPHAVAGDRAGPLDALDAMLDCEDEPYFAPNLFLHWELYGAARAAGVDVLLDGLDGDTTVSHGNGWFTELASSGRLLRLARELNAFATLHGRRRRALWWAHVVRPLLPRRGRPEPAAPLLHPAFARRIGHAERCRELRARTWGDRGTARARHAASVGRGLVPFALEVADRAARARGLEPRYPFFDRELVEFCVALPTEQKLRDGWTRGVLRRGLRGMLPDEVRLRPGKSDLGDGFVRGLRAGLRPLESARRTLARFIAAPILDDAERACRERGCRQGAQLVWRAASLAHWLQRTGLE